MVVCELRQFAQVAPWTPCPRVRIWIFPLGSNPGHKVKKKGSNHSTTWADPCWCSNSSYQRLRCVATIRNFTRRTKLIFRKCTRVLTKTVESTRVESRGLFAAFCHTWDFRRSTPDGHPMPTGTSFIPLGVLINCVSPCLMFLRLMVRCAAYAAWTTPGLVKTDETCVKLKLGSNEKIHDVLGQISWISGVKIHEFRLISRWPLGGWKAKLTFLDRQLWVALAVWPQKREFWLFARGRLTPMYVNSRFLFMI